MFAILLQAYLIFVFPMQGPSLDIFYDSNKIFSAVCESVFAFYREPIGDDIFCNQTLVFQFSKSAGQYLWGDIQKTVFDFRISFGPLGFIEL